MVEIFALACDFLCQVTLTLEATSIAILEWKVFDSLRIYLPSPLSGLLPLEEAEISSLLHNPSLESAESAAALEYARRKAQIAEYKVGLMDLPVSFFTLLANLCKIEEGKALTFSEGYVRRTLDRLSILNSKFIKHSAKYARHKQGEEWQQMSAQLSSCLVVVTNAANYHTAKHGSSNDVILHELYEFVALCKNIICWQLHTKHPRSDEILQCCYEALAAVAKDTYRINRIFEKFDIYGVIRHELALLETLPERGARAAVATIDRSCHGLTSKYLVDIIPLLREPLARVSRVYPQLSGNVRDCNWTLTRSAKLYKETVDPNYTPDQHIDAAMEEFIRSGNRYAHARASFLIRASTATSSDQGSPAGKSKHGAAGQSLLSALEKVRAMDEAHMFTPLGGSLAGAASPQAVMGTLTSTVPFSPAATARSRHSEASAAARDVEIMRPGTYLHCGVSSCGSLLLPDQPHMHGTASSLTLEERENQLLNLTIHDPHNPDRCMVSKLSARGTELQARMTEAKIKAGLRDIKLYASSAASDSPLRQSQAQSPLLSSPMASHDKLSELGKDGMQSFTSGLSSPARSLSSGTPVKGKHHNHGSGVGSPARGLSRAASQKSLRSASSSVAAVEKPTKIREILLTDLPELILTKPPK